MSQADYHPDSSVATPGSSVATPDGDAASSVPPPPPSGQRSRPAQATESADDAGPKALPPVPPPPPTRSTLPPVRPAPRAPVTSGVGAAAGVRWRGELDGVAGSPPAGNSPTGKPPRGKPQRVVEEEDESQLTADQPRLNREAPPWLVSMVFHLLVLLILALISTPGGRGIGRVMLTIGQTDQQSPSELTEFTVATEFSIADTDSLEDSDAEVDIETVFDSVQLSESVELAPVDLGLGSEIAIAKPMFNGRTGAMKKALLAIYGGSAETQEAVQRGLAWLKRNQRKDGSWSMRGPYSDGAVVENNVAATAMALLAFLGDGNTHRQGEYAAEVERGMKYLVSKQERNGFYAKQARSHEKMYAQAQASIAICELYAMSKDSWLRPSAELAVDFALKSQSPEGGWRYEPGFDSDTSVTGWFVMALQSARSAGLVDNESEFRTALERVDAFLDSASSYDGAAYAYQARGNPSAPMTAEGILCRQYISWPRDHPSMWRGIEALLVDDMFDINRRDVYYWYYATQVMHHYGGEQWQRWNRVMRVQLPKAQVRGGKEDGSWAPQGDRWGSNSGRLFTTCLSLYCLEVYYRHMPLYQQQKN
jgi:hypothetical protein